MIKLHQSTFYIRLETLPLKYINIVYIQSDGTKVNYLQYHIYTDCFLLQVSHLTYINQEIIQKEWLLI